MCLQIQGTGDGRVLPSNHPRTREVQYIVDTLAQQVEGLGNIPPHLRNIQWKVTVLDSRSVNAVAAPGGHMLVFTGAATCSSSHARLHRYARCAVACLS
jgi:predicted Zn-dependent protease